MKPKAAKQNKRTKTKPKIPQSKRICFVIMPFGGWFDEYYSEIYKPAILKAGFEPHRADDLFRPSTITSDIWDYTKRSKLVLADLTGKNPNVFYELGLAHALAKPAILIAESLADDVPFDLHSLRVLKRDKNVPNWGGKLFNDIVSSISEISASPAASVLPAFMNSSGEGPRTSLNKDEIKFLELRQDIDALRREVAYIHTDRGPSVASGYSATPGFLKGVARALEQAKASPQSPVKTLFSDLEIGLGTETKKRVTTSAAKGLSLGVEKGSIYES